MHQGIHFLQIVRKTSEFSNRIHTVVVHFIWGRGIESKLVYMIKYLENRLGTPQIFFFIGPTNKALRPP